MCTPDPQRTHHRQMQRIHLPGPSWPNVPCSRLLCSVYVAWYSWCPVDSLGCDSGLTEEFAQRCFVTPCPTHMCGAAVVQAHAAMVGGAGVETDFLLHCAQWRPVFLYCVITCRQQRLPTSSSKRQLARLFLGC